MNTLQEGSFADASADWEELLHHIVRQRRAAAATFLTIFIAGLTIAALLPPSYQAHATLALLPAPEYTVRPDVGSQQFNATALALDQEMAAETKLLESDDLHADLLQQLPVEQVYPDLGGSYQPTGAWRAVCAITAFLARPWLTVNGNHGAVTLERALKRIHKDLDIRPSKDANIIDLTFSNRDPSVASMVLEKLLAAYAAKRARLYDDPQTKAVRAEVGARENMLSASEEAVSLFKQSHSISDATLERDLLLRRRSAVEQSAIEADTAAREHHARLGALARQIAGIPSVITLFEERDPDTRLQTLVANLQDLNGRRSALRERYLDRSRMVTELDHQINARTAEVAALKRETSASISRRGRNPALDQIQIDQARTAADYAAATERRDAQKAEVVRLSSALASLDADQPGLNRLQRQVGLETEAAASETRLLAARELTEAEEASRLTNVRIIQAPRTPVLPRNVPALTILAGLFLGAVGASIRVGASYIMDKSVWTAAGVTADTGLEVLAVFPHRSSSWMPT